MKILLDKFKDYCTNPNIKSGKAASYAKAIEYLCDFLDITEINSSSIFKIENSKSFISNIYSNQYKELLENLNKNNRSSYLTNGYIKAALPQFLSFLQTKEKSSQITKVQAIEQVIISCGGSATWDDIYSKSESFYPNIKNSIEWKAGIRGVLYRELRNNRSFKRNIDGSFSLLNNEDYNKTNVLSEDIDKTVLDFLNNNQINTSFNNDKILGILPIANTYEHKYNASKTSGTTKSGLHKAFSGRKAEKYFIDFLKYNNFKENIDFIDVANNKDFGYDVKFFNIGLEIKNIKSGSFYLSDNEIAYLENNMTVLILIDIDNGIWALNNSSTWLKNVITNIKKIRQYCLTTYPNIDLTDIKINIDNKLESDCCEISQLNHDDILKVILNKN